MTSQHSKRTLNLVEAQRAYEFDPLSIIINARVGHTYYYGRRYDQAIEQYKKTLELDPNFAIAHSRLGWAYLQNGKPRDVVEEFLRATLWPVKVRKRSRNSNEHSSDLACKVFGKSRWN